MNTNKPSAKGAAQDDHAIAEDPAAAIVEIPVGDLKPSIENDRIYKPVNPNDPPNKKLAASIAKDGIQIPLVVTCDMFVLSGHRRLSGAIQAGLATVRCIVRHDICKANHDPADYLRLLTLYNDQRVKTFAEEARETFINSNPEEGDQAFTAYRQQKSRKNDFDKLSMNLGAFKGRKRISAAKMPLVRALQKIVAKMREAGIDSMSARAYHYRLLNDPPLIHASKPNSRYKNDLSSYRALLDILIRARISGLIPWDAVIDETRPLTEWDVWKEPGSFLANEVDLFAKGYSRDLLQSQINHIELFAEKLTVKPILKPIAAEFCMPLSIGKGQSSIGPRFELVERFRQSGKERLVILMVSDFDPDGQVIAEAFARTIRDDLGVSDVVGIKVAINAEHVKKYKLPRGLKAKKGSANYKKFVREYGEYVWELEALEPEDLQTIVRDAINKVIDAEAFNHEISAEKTDWLQLEALRRTLKTTMEGVQL